MKPNSIAALDAASRDRLANVRNFRHGILAICALFLLLPVIGLLSASASVNPEAAGVMAAGLPFLGAMTFGPLRDETNGDPDGAGLEMKILEGIREIKTAHEKINGQVAEIPELKSELEKIDKTIKSFEGLSSDVKAFQSQMAKYEARLAAIRKEENDPLKRITNDEEMRTLVTAPARVAYLRHNNKVVPKELLDAAQRYAEIVEGKALTGGATPGSIVINQELVKSIYQLVASHGKWSNFDVIPVGTRNVKIPVDTSDPTAVWATEGSAPSEGSYAGSQVSLTIGKILTWIGLSNDLLEDDEIGLANHLMTKFARANALKLDFSCFRADGGSDTTDGGYTGIFGGAGTAYGLATGVDNIAELDQEDFTGLIAQSDDALIGLPSSRWFMHPQILVQLLAIKDLSGRSIFLNALEAPTVGGLGSILGYPVITSNQCPSSVAASTGFLAWGDAMAMAVGVRTDFEMATSTDAKFTEDQTVFRSRMRAGVKVKLATAFEVMTFGAAS